VERTAASAMMELPAKTSLVAAIITSWKAMVNTPNKRKQKPFLVFSSASETYNSYGDVNK